MSFAASRNGAAPVGGSNSGCSDSPGNMTGVFNSSYGEDEEVTLKSEAAVEEETLGLNKYAQQKFLETAETPSLLVILSSLLQDMLSSAESGSSTLEDDCSGAAGGVGSVQQKTQRERERRPLAEDVEYLRAMIGPLQQQEAERPQQQLQAQQGDKRHQSGQEREQRGLAAVPQLVQQKSREHLVKSELQQQGSALQLAEVQAMLKGSIPAPEAGDNCCAGEPQEMQQDTPSLEAVAFVVEEDIPAAAFARADLECRFGSANDESANTTTSSSCRTGSSRRRSEVSNGDTVSKDGCGEPLQQRQDKVLVEQRWCSREAMLLQEEGQEDADSTYPTRCSSGDEQQWDSAAAAAREACGHAAGVVIFPEQRNVVAQEQLVQQKQLKREQLQQAQLKELMWAVAAAFEIQQLHPPRIRERRKRLRGNTSGREDALAKQTCSHTEDGCNGSSSIKGGSNDSNCNANAADSSNRDSRHSGGADICRPYCGDCSPCSSSSGTSVSSGSTSVALSSSIISTGTGSRSSDCTSPLLVKRNERWGGGSIESNSSSTGQREGQGGGDGCIGVETASSVSGGDSDTAGSVACSYSGTGNTSSSRCNQSSTGESTYSECSNRRCLRRSYQDGPTDSQSIGSEDGQVVTNSSSRTCSGNTDNETQTRGNPGTLKRYKRDHNERAHSSSSSNSVNSNSESCTASSSNLTSTGGHSSSTSCGFNMGSNSLEEAATCAAHAAPSSCLSRDDAGQERNSRNTAGSNLLGTHMGKRNLDGSCYCSNYSGNGDFTSTHRTTKSTTGCAVSSIVAPERRREDNECDSSINESLPHLPASPAYHGNDATPINTCSSEASAAADEFAASRCCCGEGGLEAPAAVWKRRGLLQYDALYDRWRTFLTHFAPSGMALAVCFGKSYLFHILHESMWQLLEELRLTAAGETPQRLRTFVLRLAAAAGLSNTHAEQLLSKTLFQHGNPADSILPSETGLGFLHRDAGGAREEQLGIISFCCITNDRQPQHLLQLLTIKSIFSRQLPKMPREYIVRLVFDRNHFTFCLCKRGRVTGGVCFRPYFKERFAEIAFLAVTSTEQVKGYGTRLMNHLKEHVKKSNIEYFLTYADNFALGYFRKQGFSSRITMPRDRWVGYIKDYDGGTLMECKISQKINYLQLSQLLAKQKLAVKRFINVCSPAPLCPPVTFWKENPGKLLSPLEIPALVKLGYTAAHWLSMQPLLPAAAMYLSAGESKEEEPGRRAGIAAHRGSTSGAKTMDSEKKHCESRLRGADHGEGRTATASSGSWRGGTPAAKDAALITTPSTSAGANKLGGVHPYIHHFGAGAGTSIASGSAGHSFKARVAALLSCLEKHSSSWPFRKPVSVNEAPDYYEVICRPMDIGSMKKKNRAGEYQTVGAIRADLQLMFDNCRLYNSQDTIYYKYADELQAFIWPKLNVLDEPAAA